MKQTSRWRSRLTGSMLGQLQLATYAAVLLGFTGATTTGQNIAIPRVYRRFFESLRGSLGSNA